MRFIKHPELFRKEVEQYITTGKILTVFVDEVQKVPALLDEVHSLLETYKGKVRFILTGSSARKLKRYGTNLLAGRAFTLNLHPLSHLEINIDVDRALHVGTLPAIYLDNDDPARTLKSYVETYVREEIQQEALIRNIEGFALFLEYSGQMNGEPVNYSKIAKLANISDKTAEEYFSILVDTLIAFRLNAWHYSVKKQIISAPKYYYFDCGVLNAIRGELRTPPRKHSYRYGMLFETFIIQQIIHTNNYLETDYKIYYWRTNTNLEVDLILSRGIAHRPIAIEIKSSDAPQRSDFHGLRSFASENEQALLYCLCNTPHAYTVDNIKVMPWDEGIKEILQSSAFG